MSFVADPAPRAWTGPDAVVVIRQNSPEGACEWLRYDLSVMTAWQPVKTRFGRKPLESQVCGTRTKRVACKTPSPSGVGTEMRNGAISRVPTIGASQISMSRSALR